MKAWLLVLLLVVPGWAGPLPTKDELVRAIRTARTLELVSVDPDVFLGSSTGSAVLGRMAVAGQEKRELVQALERGLHEPAVAAACFHPRHALVIRQKNRGYWLLICFECQQICAARFNPRLAYDPATIPARGRWLLTSRSPEPIFNRLLRQHHVPLPTR